MRKKRDDAVYIEDVPKNRCYVCRHYGTVKALIPHPGCLYHKDLDYITDTGLTCRFYEAKQPESTNLQSTGRQ